MPIKPIFYIWNIYKLLTCKTVSATERKVASFLYYFFNRRLSIKYYLKLLIKSDKKHKFLQQFFKLDKKHLILNSDMTQVSLHNTKSKIQFVIMQIVFSVFSRNSLNIYKQVVLVYKGSSIGYIT